MTSFVITKNLLSSYYEEHFKEDLMRCSLSRIVFGSPKQPKQPEITICKPLIINTF